MSLTFFYGGGFKRCIQYPRQICLDIYCNYKSYLLIRRDPVGVTRRRRGSAPFRGGASHHRTGPLHFFKHLFGGEDCVSSLQWRLFYLFMSTYPLNKFRKSQNCKFVDSNNLLGGTLRICDLWTQSVLLWFREFWIFGFLIWRFVDPSFFPQMLLFKLVQIKELF